MNGRAWIALIAMAGMTSAAAGTARADADTDWQQIVAMDSSAPASDQWKSREEARAGALEYLGKQEDALRAFLAAYPADAHAPDVRLRLAHLLASRADLEQDPRERRKADAILDGLEKDPAMRDRRADVEFARISIFMQRVDPLTGENRDTLAEKARGFANEFPGDRRVAPLLAEVASAFEDEPKTARALLELARPVAKTPELQTRIDDDLKRLALVGKPLQMKWTSVQGEQIDLDQLRGKAVLIYFFASWSAPSIYELDLVKQLLADAANPDSIQVLGISLDNDPVALPDMLAEKKINWPVYCDGRGWQGGLVRSLGINSLPGLWIVDGNGILRSIDPKQDAEAIIARAAKQ